jgi:hypothetical protein
MPRLILMSQSRGTTFSLLAMQQIRNQLAVLAPAGLLATMLLTHSLQVISDLSACCSMAAQNAFSSRTVVRFFWAVMCLATGIQQFRRGISVMDSKYLTGK